MTHIIKSYYEYICIFLHIMVRIYPLCIDDEIPFPIDLLEGPIRVHPVGIEPTNSPIMSWAL